MPHQVPVDLEVERSRRYFSSVADDYHRAFVGDGHNLLHRVINRTFRRESFQRRTSVITQLLADYGVSGKRVLDLGSGSGEVALAATKLGAIVTGLDVAPEMVEIARREAQQAGLADRVTFRVHDIVRQEVPATDLAMMVGVVEYYGDLDPILSKVCAATRERLIICDTRGPWWRRALRHGLAFFEKFYLHYRAPEAIAAIARKHGFREEARIAGYSFTVMVFERA